MFYPLYADYEAKEKPIIKIFGRNEKGEKIVFEGLQKIADGVVVKPVEKQFQRIKQDGQ